MSLLADLLSKVKHEKQDKHESGIPPTLQRVVSASKQKKNVGRPFVIMGCLALVMFVAGLGIVYYMTSVAGPSLKPVTAQTSLRQPSPPENIQKQSEALRISVERPPDKAIKEPAEKAERDMPLRQGPVAGAKGRTDNKYLPLSPGPAAVKGGILSVPQRATRSEKKPSTSGTGKTVGDEEAPGTPKELTEKSKAEKDEFLYTARNYETDKDYHKALHFYRKTLELDRRNYMIMNNISSILISLGLYEEAIKYSRDALSIKKDYAPSLVNIGISLVQSGKLADGRDYLLRARSLEPSNRNVIFNLALLYEKTEDYGEAQKLYLRLYEMEDIQGYLGVARVAESMGKTDDAKRTYRKILARDNVDSKMKKVVSERLSVLESR